MVGAVDGMGEYSLRSIARSTVETLEAGAGEEHVGPSGSDYVEIREAGAVGFSTGWSIPSSR